MNAVLAVFPSMPSSHLTGVAPGAQRPARAAAGSLTGVRGGKRPEAQAGRVGLPDEPADVSGVVAAVSTPSPWAMGGRARRKPLAGAVVLGLHVLLAAGLWNGWAHEVLPRAKVLIPVHWIAPAEPRPQPKAAQHTPDKAPQQVAAAPVPVARVSEAGAPVSVPVVVTEAPVPERVAPVAVAAPVVAAPVAPVVQTPAAPQKVVVNAPRYLVEPRLNMPLASRRLGEQGLVQLRLHIGTDGQLISATVAKSSGFERLDAQALKDIRTARFSPLVENGRAVEWECLAPLAYELTR